MACHTEKNTDFAKMNPSIPVDQIKKKCITCHMPKQESQVLNVRLEQDKPQTPAIMRSHLIRVYPDTISSITLLYNKGNH
jgi:hypothetical protein